MCATFNADLTSTILSCYCPTNVRDEMDLTTSYNRLSSITLNILKHNFLIICGKMNSQIGKVNIIHFAYTTIQTEITNI